MSFTQSPTSWTNQPAFFPASVETKQDDNDSTEFDDSGDESYGDSAVDLGKYDVVKKTASNTTGPKQNNTTTQLAELLMQQQQQQQNQGRKDSASTESTLIFVQELRKILQEKEEFKANEIRKIIKEELDQIHTASGTKQSPAPAPDIRLQPPSGGSTRAPSPRVQPRPRSYTNETSASTQPDLSPRSNTIPGVQWSNSVPPVSSPAGTGWSSSPTSFTGRSPFEISAVDAKWGQLFDEKGVETKRLSQILTGIGQYILEEFLPQKTTVINPEKLASFYAHHKVDSEPHPFTDIFRNRSLSQQFYSKLQDLFESLSCEYYLIPSSSSGSPKPIVPSLTPQGWQRWMTLSIRSYPDVEARRFSSVFSTLPINAVSLLDGKLERLPKQISRHLFPEKPDISLQSLFNKALDAMRRSSSETTTTRAISPRSRYRPASNSSGVPSPPSSLTGDDEYIIRKERRSSNASARRDPPPPNSSRTTTGYHRNSVSGGLSGYPAPFGRSVSDASVYTSEKGRRESKSRDDEKRSRRNSVISNHSRSGSVVSSDRRG
ncbi:hypothetical protein QBC38DRAFT_171414 [Podospora fimiseda]|uniref:DUF7514 domain-containing protein n=1 Tax=Podospora fimiseda TaxID=252190 RepID=A0AAN7H5A6_9PEZI|nr:hypothetical protein QBC38DRAFT_171414 [Podospora fimiseda]